ncbi:hypothetical protein ACFVS2_22095 [Brevibacillus sp. NPDC058079]|uniref:hypothetical protein n=1 Tax=Brevibacillus sp. NPDC058079 TaxID=3346330 RepID=UPI0036E18044
MQINWGVQNIVDHFGSNRIIWLKQCPFSYNKYMVATKRNELVTYYYVYTHNHNIDEVVEVKDGHFSHLFREGFLEGYQVDAEKPDSKAVYMKERKKEKQGILFMMLTCMILFTCFIVSSTEIATKIILIISGILSLVFFCVALIMSQSLVVKETN